MIATIEGYRCTCDVCGATWQAFILVSQCRNRACFSRRWNGDKKRGRPLGKRKQAEPLAKPKRVRSLTEY